MKPLRFAMTRDAESGRAGNPAADARLARRILIVEDNYFVAHQCESALVEAGYDVVDVVETADQAVQAAMDRRPELVLMDIYLPGKRDGIDAAVEIFQRFGIRSIPTIVAFKNGREVARQSGALGLPQLLQWVDANVAQS